MKLQDYDFRLREAWAIHQAFLRLGFTAEELWLGVSVEGGLTVHLCAQSRQFVCLVGDVTEEEVPTLCTMWAQMIQAFLDRSFPLADVNRCYESSNVYANAVPLLHALLDKGFVLPKGLN